MSAPRTIDSATFIGQGRARIGLIILFLCIGALLLFGHHVPNLEPLLESVNKRAEAGYSALFTFLAVFWAAVLTIWSLLKSRATRYVERLSDNVVFMEFMRDLEVRLVVGMVLVVFSFVVYVINPFVSFPADKFTYMVGVWLFLYGAAISLLFDSLLTARILL